MSEEMFVTGKPVSGQMVISLPIDDRRTSAACYAALLGKAPFGEPADDGVPEPLQFVLNEATTLMLIPRGGFGWVIGDNEVASVGQVECLLSLTEASPAAVRERVEVGRAAGATVVVEPERQPWGFVAVIADPDGHLWQIHADVP